MKILIIGYGLIGKERLKALEELVNIDKKEINIIGIVDPVFKNNDYKEKLNYTIFENLSEFSFYNNKKSIDWVFICTPHFETVNILNYFKDYNCNFLVEKPLGRDINEFKLFKSEFNKNIKIYVGFNYRFFQGINLMLQDIKNKIFGDLISVNLTLAHGNSPGMEKSWKLNKQMCGGGALLDPGIHLIDLAMLISNNTLSLISFAQWEGFWNTGIDEDIHIIAKSSDKTIYNFNISLVRWRSTFKIEINGTEGYGIVSGRGKSYGDQSYTRGKRWGWLNSKSQKDSEELVLLNYNCNDSFYNETKLILYKTNTTDIIHPATDLDNEKSLEFINSIYKL
jgi:predicted dehydrogenase